MFVIMPFEKDFYNRFDYETDYIGNPVYDSLRDHEVNPEFIAKNKLNNKPIIAVLPGSRKQEIENMLHIMLSIIPSFREFQFVVAAVSTFDKSYYENFNRDPNIKIVYDQTYD